MADIPIPPIPPRRAPLIDIMRELEARPRQRQSQEFDPVAAMAAERRATSRQPLPLPPIPPAVAPPRTAGDSAEAGPPLDLSAVAPTIRSRLPEGNPYVAAAIDIAEKYNLPRDVFLSLVHQESKFDPKAKSPRGAFGLTQLMPGTARELGVDPRDPMANLDAGARYLRQQIDRFGSLPLALAAYNAGPQRVIDAGRVVPNIRETQDYVHKIMRNAGMEGYGYAEGGLAELDEKYADGGRIRRPAAAPVASPFDADYIERLAAQAVGAGEPVTELRSSEGRGFAPMPRSFGEAGQRMAAVIRGDVEPTPEEERQINVVRGFTEGPAAIKAFHGSPHRFEQFDINKVGTGEGAQAYGRGLYFAEFEPVAQSYRDKLGTPPALETQSGRIIGRNQIDGLYREAFDYLNQASGDYSQAVKLAKDYGNEAAADVLRLYEKEGHLLRPGTGHMYEVNLNANPRDFLNWDLPLSQQSRDVQESLSRFGLRADSAAMRAYDDALLDALHNDPSRPLPRMPRDPTGEEIYQRALRMTPEEARVALMQAGIPGTRYLDAMSRGVGGTYNYAVFDPEIIDITRRYAEGGLAALDEKYADGGTVRAPKETTIAGQEHKLAYITDREAALLKARGGSGRMTDYGVRAYDEGPGGEGPGGDPSDNANSMSESATQDAVGGNQGQGAGPTGAGAGGGPPGNDPGPTGEGQSEVNTPGMAPGISTAPTAVGPIGPEDEANAAAAKGAMANAPMGFEGYGIMDAIDAYNSGRMGLAQAIGYGIASVAAPPGVSVGFNVDPQTQTQTPAMSVSVPGVIGGLMGLATGVPGAGVIGGFIGNEIGKELGLDPTVMSYEPGVFNAPEPTPAYGAAGYGMDYGQGYAHGGLAKLHQKYAEGGEVEDDGGVERYDPREIDALASEFMAESNPADLMQRARLMMRGMNVGMPTNVGALNLSDNENVSTYTGLREMPIEDDRFARALRTLNTGINATLDQERGIRLGAGLQALQDAGDRGMSGYGANLSAGYGPVSLHGGYQSQLQAYPGAKPQGVYTYGGNLNIPLDDEGAKALLGAQVMSGRRGSAGAGNAGTLITGGLERPFRGGTLGVDVSVDPTLRNKEILFGYRRAF